MTAATPKADKIQNRAPKGGMVSTVNGLFYRGGWFMPTVPAEVVAARPAPLVGSSRQVAWATRLRAELLAATEARLAEVLAGMEALSPGFRPYFREEVRSLTISRHRILTTTSAAAFIEAR